jgi:hypothetical protein
LRWLAIMRNSNFDQTKTEIGHIERRLPDQVLTQLSSAIGVAGGAILDAVTSFICQ